MRELTLENITALANRELVIRDFIWIVAKNRSTGADEAVGFWSDIENVTATVINPDTNSLTSRSFYGAGGLISIADVPSTSNLQVQEVQITMSQLDEMVEQAFRLYETKQARIEIHRGLFDPNSRLMVSPAFPRFVGFINNIDFRTGIENEDGGVRVTCVSHTQELIRANPSTRGHEDQINLRQAGDRFFVDAAVVSDWELDWGDNQNKVEPQRQGLFGWGNFLGFL